MIPYVCLFSKLILCLTSSVMIIAAIRTVLSKYANGALPEPPPLPERIAYGEVTMLTIGSLFDILEHVSQPSRGIRMEWPLPMEQVKQVSNLVPCILS